MGEVAALFLVQLLSLTVRLRKLVCETGKQQRERVRVAQCIQQCGNENKTQRMRNQSRRHSVRDANL